MALVTSVVLLILADEAAAKASALQIQSGDLLVNVNGARVFLLFIMRKCKYYAEMQMRKRKYADEAAELDRRGTSVLTGGRDSEGEGNRSARQPQFLDKRVDDVDGDAVQHEGIIARQVPGTQSRMETRRDNFQENGP